MPARELAKATDAAFVHPFDDPDVIAGHGTCGLEISQQLGDFDSVLVPVGGGGLISGIAIALKSVKPKAKVFGVEPRGAPKLTEALAAKKIVGMPSPASIADGLTPSSLGGLTFDACSRYVDGVFTASEEEILNATKSMVKAARMIAEPSVQPPSRLSFRAPRASVKGSCWWSQAGTSQLSCLRGSSPRRLAEACRKGHNPRRRATA